MRFASSCVVEHGVGPAAPLRPNLSWTRIAAASSLGSLVALDLPFCSCLSVVFLRDLLQVLGVQVIGLVYGFAVALLALLFLGTC